MSDYNLLIIIINLYKIVQKEGILSYEPARQIHHFIKYNIYYITVESYT